MRRRDIMKRIVIIVVSIIFVTVGFAYGQDIGAIESKAIRFAMPPPKVLNMEKPVKCTAIATAAIFEERKELEDFNKPKLSVKVEKGTDKLRLWLDGEVLTVQVRDEKPETYKVTGHNTNGGWLVALNYGGLVPAAYSISLNKNNGFAVWSLNEPIFVMGSLYPYAQCVYLYCTN
jgi:hypothetical protein